MADAAARHTTPEMLRKWGMMEAEEQGLREKLENSMLTLSAEDRSAMDARLVELSAKRESRNQRYFSQAKAQDLGNLLKDLGLIQYLYLVCGAYGTMQRLRDEVESRGADWVADELMALPMTEEHAWKLLGAGLGIKGGPGQGGKRGKGGKGGDGRGGRGAGGHGDGGDDEFGRRGRRGSGGSDDSSQRRGGRHGECEDGYGRHGQGRDGHGDGGGETDGAGGRKRGYLSHAERVRRFLSQHEDLVEAERLRNARRSRKKKRRRSKRAEERYAVAEEDEEAGWGEDGIPHPLLDATCKLWTARLDGVGVSVRGRKYTSQATHPLRVMRSALFDSDR